MKELILAPGVVFDEEAHEYHLNGRKLSGVTGAVGNHVGKKFPKGGIMDKFVNQGKDTHKNVERWLKGEGCALSEASQWVVSELQKRCKSPQEQCFSEVLVSDFEKYASAVDIIIVLPDNTLELIDIKRGFDRPYVTWQLSVYKFLIEKHTRHKVSALTCFAAEARTVFKIYPESRDDTGKMLYGSGYSAELARDK